MRPEQPRGIRNYNPGNIRHANGVRWQGTAPNQTDSQFVQYLNPRPRPHHLSRQTPRRRR
jgi:hypothetical protein